MIANFNIDNRLFLYSLPAPHVFHNTYPRYLFTHDRGEVRGIQVEPGPTTVKETRDNISRAILRTMGASRFIVGLLVMVTKETICDVLTVDRQYTVS